MTNDRQFFNFPNLWGPPGSGSSGGWGPGPYPGGPGGHSGGHGQHPGNSWGPGPGPGSPGGQGGGTSGGPPATPPPTFTPEQQQLQTFAVDPGAIRGCLFRFTYVWLERSGFWFYPVFVGRRSVSGYRWAGFRWVYVGIDLNHIQSFQCF